MPCQPRVITTFTLRSAGSPATGASRSSTATYDV
jgi:hypothetical protein